MGVTTDITVGKAYSHYLQHALYSNHQHSTVLAHVPFYATIVGLEPSYCSKLMPQFALYKTPVKIVAITSSVKRSVQQTKT